MKCPSTSRKFLTIRWIWYPDLTEWRLTAATLSKSPAPMTLAMSVFMIVLYDVFLSNFSCRLLYLQTQKVSSQISSNLSLIWSTESYYVYDYYPEMFRYQRSWCLMLFWYHMIRLMERLYQPTQPKHSIAVDRSNADEIGDLYHFVTEKGRSYIPRFFGFRSTVFGRGFSQIREAFRLSRALASVWALATTASVTLKAAGCFSFLFVPTIPFGS